MELRTYRVIGTATYLDRGGAIHRINVNLTTEAPDPKTAELVVLAAIEARKGANGEYDPQARWGAGYPPVVGDETVKQEAIEATGLTVGAKVLHRAKGSVKRGADARQGVVKRIYTVTKNGRPVVRVTVDWPAPRRINGDGWHRSDVLASALILATPEEVERRRSLNRARSARQEGAA